MPAQVVDEGVAAEAVAEPPSTPSGTISEAAASTEPTRVPTLRPLVAFPP